MLTLIRRFGVLLVNLAVLIGVLVGVEVAARVYSAATDRRKPDEAVPFQFYPYVMTGQVSHARYQNWYDSLRRKPVPTQVTANNYGFSDTQDFQITKPYVKQSNEKTVLLSGGSTAFGIGASSNAHILHEVLEQQLDAAQGDTHYTVINLSQGGWTAQQQAIALDLWGRLYNPDWVITLDGVNDAMVGCVLSQGTGNPAYFQLISSLVDGYLGSQEHAVYFRGAWENQVIKYSAAYRLLTGQSYIPPPAYMEGGRHMMAAVVVPTLLSSVRDQVDFYLLSETSMLERFRDAKFILATQPTSQDFAALMGDYYRDGDDYTVDPAARLHFAADLDAWLQSFKPDQQYCTRDARITHAANRYIMAMSAIRLAALTDDYRARQRDVEYFNTGVLYPKDTGRRADFFIDRYHLNDTGLLHLARFYAYHILRRDFPGRDWSSLRPENMYFH